jgi:hypothetical protein
MARIVRSLSFGKSDEVLDSVLSRLKNVRRVGSAWPTLPDHNRLKSEQW